MNQFGSSWGALLWFFAIIAMIPLVLWLFKRSPLGGGAVGSAGAPRTVAVLPLSTQQKVVTVEVGLGEERLWLVLGVTAQGIRTLHTMAPPAPAASGPATATPPPAAFAQLLGRLRGKDGGHAK
ncbi:MAG: flagellar biosynthetic protein FliO [Chitinophagaceae bacterium]|nr:flagellar biosynthetic protein FliO [Rubrivivax sp.]